MREFTIKEGRKNEILEVCMEVLVLYNWQDEGLLLMLPFSRNRVYPFVTTYFSECLSFSTYRSCVFLVQFIPRHSIIFVVIVNSITEFVSQGQGVDAQTLTYLPIDLPGQRNRQVAWPFLQNASGAHTWRGCQGCCPKACWPETEGSSPEPPSGWLASSALEIKNSPSFPPCFS